MFRNKKFGFYAVILCLTGLVYFFLCAGLEGGQLEVIRGRIAGADQNIELPMTVGAFLAVPTAALAGTFFLRRGIRQGLILFGGLAALGCIGLINARDIYWLFFASMALIRCACTALQMGVAALGVGWFIRCRGRALGLMTMGAPLFSAVGAGAVANFIQTRLGGDHRPFYLALAAVLALMALAVRFLLRDRPEDAGLYPDGDGYAPDEGPEPGPLTVGGVWKMGRTWLLLLAFGGYCVAAAGVMGVTHARFLAVGGQTVWVSATPWLSLGAILALPVSYCLGWISDKLGAPAAGAILGAGMLLGPAALWRMPAEGSIFWEIAWSVGAAFILGGLPTLLPCALAHVYGRGRYMAGARAVLPLLLLLSAAAPPLALAFIGGAWGESVCLGLLAAAALGLLFCLTLLGLSLRKKKS